MCSAGEADFCNPQSNRSNKNDKRGPCLKSDRPSRTEREHWEADMDFRDVQETGASNVMISEQADLLEAPAKAAETATAKLAEAMARLEEHTSELQSIMRISYAGICLKKTNT